MSICFFGCDQTASQLCVFGGYQYLPSQSLDTIQIYDKTQNTWQESEAYLDRRATASAIYITDKRQFLIYNNGYCALDTQIFEFKKVVNLNEFFPVQSINTYQPVLSRNNAFQFDINGNLSSYNLSNKEWKQVKVQQS